MVSVSSNALSGLYASEKRLSTAAENIANADVIGFKAKDVAQSTNDNGGVATSVVNRNPATVTVPDGNGGTVEKPNVSLDEEVIQADIATYSAKANIIVLKAQDKMDKYLLDIQA
ncbi:MAG: flagellar basal body protein [Pseudomonadota bacterium]